MPADRGAAPGRGRVRGRSFPPRSLRSRSPRLRPRFLHPRSLRLAPRSRRPGPRPRDVPLRRSLLLKLLALSALVSACSIAATAWLSAHITAVAVRQEQGQVLADDARIYDALLGYAADHPDWAGAAGAVRALARDSGHRITLTDRARHVLLDSATPGSRPPDLPAQASATVDPLAVDAALAARSQLRERQTGAGAPSAGSAGATTSTPGPCAPGTRCLPPGPSEAPDPSALRQRLASQDAAASGTRARSGSVAGSGTSTEAASVPPGADLYVPPAASTIDARAVGPFRLTASEHARLHTTALQAAACLRDRLHLNAEVGDAPSGRPVITTAQTGLYLPTDCDTGALAALTPTEQRALTRLDALADACLDHRGAPHVAIDADFGWTPAAPQATGADATRTAAAPTARDQDLVATCIDTARREQLAPYVAAPALLFVSSPPRAASAFLDLSAGNRARVAEVTGLVLLLTLAVTALAGTRTVRPLRALAGAARRMTEGDLSARVRVTSHDEIGGVAAAFNTMAERREQAEGLRKAMVSDVAHELRTPLSNIRGWLEAAEDGLVVPDRALLASLLDEAVLLQHVIDDLRDLSAADAGELRMHPRAVDLADLLAQLATAHRGAAEAAGVTLLTTPAPAEPDALDEPDGPTEPDAPSAPDSPRDPHTARAPESPREPDAPRPPDAARPVAPPTPQPPSAPPDAPVDRMSVSRRTDKNRSIPATVHADPVRLRQAIGNLVSNAVRHTPPGGTVTVTVRSGPQGATVIEVADTGSGIGAEDLPKVFDRFWRAEKSRSRQTGGSGLGLSIARKIAEAHGGTIGAVSAPGAGSVFTITVPGPR